MDETKIINVPVKVKSCEAVNMLEQRASDLSSLPCAWFSHWNFVIDPTLIWAFLVKQISGVKSLKTPRSEHFPSAYPKPSECTGTELSFSQLSEADGRVLVGTMCCPWPAGHSEP